jgi:hypothetical protein
MKKLFVLVAAIVISAASFAQSGSTGKQTGAPASSSKKTMYICPKCGATSDKAGNCPTDKIALIQQGMYYCPKDYTTSAKAGKCPKCKAEMVQMEPKGGNSSGGKM